MKRGMEDPLKREREGVHLIIAGTETGSLCVLDNKCGETQCTVKVREGGKEGEKEGEREGGRDVK